MIAFNLNKKLFLDELAIFTIGFPFVSFKVLLGLILWDMSGIYIYIILGSLLIIWGLIDLFINGMNLIFLTFKKRYFTSVCLLANICSLRHRHDSSPNAWKDLGTALDVMLSFSIVAIIVGGNLFHYMTEVESVLWSVSVVVNVLGAGISRIFLSVEQVSSP